MLSASAALYDGQTRVSLISPAGVLISDSANCDHLGQPLESDEKTLYARDLQHSGRIRDTDAQIRLLLPVQPIPGNPAWSLSL